MKREIRFRVWHKAWKKMFELGCTHYIDAPEYGEPIAWDNEDFEFMQFTGLKDKNGKDIYEGDICKVGDVAGAIDFHNGRFCWTDGACHWDLVLNNAVDHCPIESKIERCGDLSVIGNVWENPKLLEAKP